MLWLGVGLAVFLSVAMAFACRTALSSGRSGRIDAIWTLSTGAAGVIAALWPTADAQPARQALAAILIAVWSLRLGTYMWRRAESGPDDPRYATMKREWGEAAPARLFRFLQAQALCSWPLVAAVFVAAHAPRAAPDWRDAAAVALFCLALGLESVADAQMAAFRRDPRNRGRICDTGLWAWSRHPNYFFEWLVWWTWPLIAIQMDHAAGWVALAAPALMYWLLAHVSGVPPLEAELRRSRPEAFADYERRVSRFFPAPPG
ncbi:MAG: DUF1295 domain-containing protein [Beijerinckiaceae bacterium]